MVNRRVPAGSPAFIGRLIVAADKGEAELLAPTEVPSRTAGFHGARIAAQSHINATSEPPQSVLIANRLQLKSHPKATPMRPQCDPKATPRLHQSHPQATPSGTRLTPGGGCERV